MLGQQTGMPEVSHGLPKAMLGLVSPSSRSRTIWATRFWAARGATPGWVHESGSAAHEPPIGRPLTCSDCGLGCGEAQSRGGGQGHNDKRSHGGREGEPRKAEGKREGRDEGRGKGEGAGEEEGMEEPARWPRSSLSTKWRGRSRDTEKPKQKRSAAMSWSFYEISRKIIARPMHQIRGSRLKWWRRANARLPAADGARQWRRAGKARRPVRRPALPP